MERYWPHGAGELLDRLLRALKPGGRLLVVGLEPYELVLDRKDERDAFVLDVEAAGDAAASLVGEPNYRELPARWVANEAKARGFAVAAAHGFPMTLTSKSLRKQLDFAKDVSAKIGDAGLKAAFQKRVVSLEKGLGKWAKGGAHANARNYAMILTRPVERVKKG